MTNICLCTLLKEIFLAESKTSHFSLFFSDRNMSIWRVFMCLEWWDCNKLHYMHNWHIWLLSPEGHGRTSVELRQEEGSSLGLLRLVLVGWTEQWCCVLPGFRQGLLENRLFLVCVRCVYVHIHTRSFNQSYELLQQCQSTADRALLHFSFWGLSLLGSFITCVNCCETWFHLSNVFLLGLPFPPFFLV